MDFGKLGYRPHIDGLRAIAVVLVFIFHLLPDSFPGGYLGVDVFFVISGFVITQSLYKTYLSSGKIKLGEFYLRRFMRLYPALLAMVSIVTIIYLLFGFLWDTNLLVKSGLSAIFAFSNLYFLKQENDYFHQDLINPFLHTWSLGIEEQFYLLYPLFLLGLLFILKNNKWREISLAAILFFTTIILYLVFALSPDSMWTNYYWPTARFWELLIGCALFFVSFKYPPKKFINSFIILGFGILFYAVIAQEFIQNVAIETLLAVCGTSLIVYAGLTNLKNITHILSGKLILYIGALSYSLYLWHLPVIYFLHLYTPVPLYLVLSPIITLLCAMISYHFIEQRFRKSERLKSVTVHAFKYLFVIAVFAGLLVALFGVKKFIVQTNVTLNTFSQEIKAFNFIENKANLSGRTEIPYMLGNVAMTGQCSTDGTEITKKTDILNSSCLKNGSADTVFYVTGDSHALHYLPMLQEAFPEMSIYYHQLSARNLFEDSFALRYQAELLPLQLAQVRELSNRYKNVVVFESFFFSQYEDSIHKIEESIRERINVFDEYSSIIFVTQTPVFSVGPASCAAVGVNCWFYKSIQEESLTNELLEKLTNEFFDVSLYNPTTALCAGEKCQIYDAERDFLLYRDDDHISIEASKSLSEHFTEWFTATSREK